MLDDKSNDGKVGALGQKNAKVYIAGHRGLVGFSLMQKLQSKGYINLITRTHSQIDLVRQDEVEKFFNEERPEYVFLAAAKVGGILANDTYKAEFIYNNLMIFANVIHSAYKHKIKKLLNLGSSCIYPKFAQQPMKEEYFLTGSLEPTNEPYAIAKITAIKLCRFYNEQYGTNFISVMPTNLYGPNDNFNLETTHALPALIRKFHLAKQLKNKDFYCIRKDIQRYPLGFGLDKKVNLADEESIKYVLNQVGVSEYCVTLWGSGEPYREFLYVEDLADACVFLMENYGHEEIGEFINIGIGKDIRIKELAKIVQEIVEFEGEIKYDSSKPDGTPRKLLEVSRIKSLGWQPNIDLKNGIKKTYQWYVETISNVETIGRKRVFPA